MSNVDRTKLNLVLANLVINAVADPTLRGNVFSEIYDLLALRAAETDVLLKTNTTPYTPGASYNPSTKKYTDDSIAALILNVLTRDNVTAFTPTANYHPATKSYVDQTTAGVILGQVPDSSITTAKLAQDVQAKLSQIYTSERAVANLLARSTIANRTDGANGIIYDLNDGLNTGSAGKIDKTSTNVVGATAIGTSTVTVKSVTGIVAGQEFTIFDDVNLERLIVQSVDGTAKTVTFTVALTKAYKDSAQLCRSSVVQDTTNKLLIFGGWSHQSTVTQTGSTVVASAYDTSGNGSRKNVKTTNGNLFAVMRNGTTDFRITKSTDNGTTTPWPTIVTVTESVNDVALATDGTYLYVLSSVSTTGAIFRKYDQSGVLQGSAVNVDSGQTAMGNVSLAVAPDNSLHATWASKNATYPNSFNIRYSKSTDGGVTWATPTQRGTSNTAGQDNTNPCIVVRSNNYPVILFQYASSSLNVINCDYWNGSAWTGATVYNGTTYAQTNPSATIKQNGLNAGRIICSWHGLDSTDTTRQNERWSYSDDGGATWSAMVKITSGNTVDRQKGVLAEDASGNIYNVYMDNTGISYQQLPNGSTTWGAVQTLNAAGTNPAVLERGLDFTKPLTVYMSASIVKFDGTLVIPTITPVLVEDVRYNITPPSNVSSAVAWVDRQTDAGLSLAASLSIHSAAENFTAMTKTTSTLDGTTSEDQFTGTGTSNSKATLRVTMTRTSTSITKAETQLTGAVGA